MNKQTNTILMVLTILCIILMIYGIVTYMIRPETIEYPQDHYISENFELYFVPSEKGFNALFSEINSSQDSIHCALRSLNYPPLEDLIFQKEDSGVKVRLFIHSDYIGNKNLHRPFVKFSPEGYAMMHNNYCILDEETVITGSTIFNGHTLPYNFHDLVIIHSKDLASLYTTDFWMIYNNQSVRNSQRPAFIEINPSLKVKALFCPRDDCEDEYVTILNSSNSKIMFATYAFTNPKITEVITDAIKRDVLVTGIVESEGLTPSSIVHHEMEGIKIDQFNRKIHTKIVTIDDDIAITGTLNPSIKGVTYNQENVLIIDNQEVNKIYSDYVSYLYNFERQI